MSTLYPAKVNSPVTELSAAIDAAATTITVLNGNALPDAPNIATIGQGDTAETIQYGGKTGNTLSEVVRGFQGAARSWTSGTKIARNFTAYDYDTIRQRLDDASEIPAPIVRGSNVIYATQASGATFKVLGCTLCNILGRDGGCESLTPLNGVGGTLAIDSADFKSGASSASLTTTTSSGTATIRTVSSYVIDPTKCYLVAAWIKKTGLLNMSLRVYDESDSTIVKSSSLKTVNDTWDFDYIVLQPSDLSGHNRIRLRVAGTITATGNILKTDEIRLYEVSAAEYAAIGTTITGEAIDRRWPYVDGVQHLQGASLAVQGKNLLPPFTQWTLHANAAVTSPYTLSLTATAGFQASSITVPAVAGQAYSFTGETGRFLGEYRNAAGVKIGDWQSAGFITNGRTETAPTGTAFIRISTGNSSAGSFTFGNPMLVIGDATNLPASFVPYSPNYAHAPIKLASNVDRTIADIYDSATGQVFRQYVTDVKMDGTLPWSLNNTYTGFKRVGLSALAVSYRINTVPNGVKYDGTILGVGNTASAADRFGFQAVSPFLLLSVSNADSGWTDAINPNANAIKALMNGWKANSNNGTVYNSWVSILTGAAPATNTEAFVAANKAPGWDAYATLDYVRATPITETLTGDLGALSMVKGGNTVELLEGVVVREKANPFLVGANYLINRDAVGDTSKLKYRADRILAIYKETAKDTKWNIDTVNPSGSYGNVRASIPVADYDPAAEYYVDYIVLDKYAYTANAVDATLTYQSTLGGAVAQATVDIAGLKQHNGVQDWQLMLDEAYAANLRMDLDAATARATNNIRALSQGGMI